MSLGFFELVFGFTALIVLVPMLSNHWYKMRVKQWEMSLKHTMLERGMSPDEIQKVLDASAKNATAQSCWGKSCDSEKNA